MIGTTLPETVDFNKILFTTNSKKIGFDYAIGGSTGQGSGYLLEFKVPRSYVTNNGRNVFGNRWNQRGRQYLDANSRETLSSVYPSTIFTEGLPTKYLKSVYNVGQTSVNDAQKALYKEHKLRKKAGENIDPEFIGR